jgi:carboxymethylenebutenolidase
MELPESPDRTLGAVLVIHSWWGLTDSFRQYGAALAAAGFVTGLADLFNMRVAKTAAQARALRGRRHRVPIYRTLPADIETLRCAVGGERKVGVVGFSMGGHWAIWLSQRPEYEIAATVLYYASRGGSFGQCQSSILAHFADRDDWVSKSARRTMESSISAAGCEFESHDYPDTTHWFAESDRSEKFDAASARKALERDIDFLRATLAN